MKSIKNIVEELSKPLDIKDIDWRVQSAKKSKSGNVGMIVLGYKDARVDMNRLDQVTDGLWQNEYKRDSNGVLQCGIGIYCNIDNDKYQWIWKWSNGVESKEQSEKGEYSDAFKRAGFMWGIGRELYDLPFIWIGLNQDEYYERGDKVIPTLLPNSLQWTIDNGLVAKDENGVIRFSENGTVKKPKQNVTNNPNVKSVKEVKIVEDAIKLKIPKCQSLEELAKLYKDNESIVQKNLAIKKLFTDKKLSFEQK